MADDTNDIGSRSVIALLAPVKQGKKAANKRSDNADNAPKVIKPYADYAKAIEAVTAVGNGMVDLDDSQRGLLKTAALHFSVLSPINHEVWEDHFRDEMKKRYQDTGKLSRVKTALIAFSNCDDTGAALALIEGHTSLQAFCTAVRPSLVKAGLVKASNAGAPVKAGSNKPDKPSKVVNMKGETVITETDEETYPDMMHGEAAAILANPPGEGEHDQSVRYAHLLEYACTDMVRLRSLIDWIANQWPAQDNVE